MKYKVIVSDSAKCEILEAYEWIAERTTTKAVKWLLGVEAAIGGLNLFPASHALARENGAIPSEIRQLLYGKRQHKYRILHTIQGNDVVVLHVRHAARPALHRGEIQWPDDLP